VGERGSPRIERAPSAHDRTDEVVAWLDAGRTTRCLRLASRLAGPRAIIWYTVDYDAQKVDLPAIRNAFVALKDALNGEYRVGAYASGYVCEELFKDGLLGFRPPWHRPLNYRFGENKKRTRRF
jgi:hypothetical protein